MGSGKDVEVVGLRGIRVLRRVFGYYLFLLLFWGFYRFLFRFPENFEELFLKPLFWLLPLYQIVKKTEKKPLASLGLTTKNLSRGIFLGLGIGVFFMVGGLLANVIKYGQFNFSQTTYSGGGLVIAFLVSVVTAFTEELVFRGYVFNRFNQVWNDQWLANIVSSFLFALIHLPITVFVLQYSPGQVIAYGLLVFVYSFGSGFVFARTASLAGPIIMHLLWSWPIILFR